MNSINKEIKILSPINQPYLYGYDKYFDFFIKLCEKNEMPNCILLSGPKGLGKSTFAFHMANYILSKNEENRYSIGDYNIHQNNSSYRLVNLNIHPNFFLIENKMFEKDIKIDQIRDLLRFLNKSTYSKDIRIIMIDNSENLNLNSSNALLKSIEEPQNNTFFFIIHNSSCTILETIKSRCTEFKFTFSSKEKKNIFKDIVHQYEESLEINEVIDDYYFESPGNLIKYFLPLYMNNIKVAGNTLECIYYFIDKYKNAKDPETLSFLSLFIEKFYKELCSSDIKNLNSYFYNQSKILKYINDMKKFNLDKKNVLIYIKDILQNETK